MPWAARGGFFNAAMTVTLFDNPVSVTPDADRTHAIAVFNTVVNVALFAGPILASLLARQAAGIETGLRLAAGMGLAVGVLLALRRRM